MTKKQRELLASLFKIEEQLHALLAQCDAAGMREAADAIAHVCDHHVDAIRDAIENSEG